MRKSIFSILIALFATAASLSTLSAAVTSLTLVNADSNADIQTINDGDTIDLAALPTANLNIRANVDVAPTNVVMNLTGATTHSQTEGVAPYALWGDSSGDYDPGSLNVGAHALWATPAGGSAYTVNFTVINGGGPPPPPPNPPADGVYLESNGMVIMEMENTESALDKWVEKTSVGGHTGNGYLEFTGNSPLNGPATSPLEYEFKITTPGLYYLHLHCARENVVINGENRTDVANDAYVRVEGDYSAGPNAGNSHGMDAPLSMLQSDTKFFGGNHNQFVWASGNRLDPGGHNNKRVAIYDFKAGETYKLVVSGRSQLFKINRLMFRHKDVAASTAQNLSNEESERATTSSTQKKIAYIHGDVAADGTIPSDAAAYDQMLLDDTGNNGCSEFKAMVEGEGHAFSQHYDATTTLDVAFLNQYDVVIFGLHQKVWSATEKTALDTWLRAGGGALFYSDSAAGGLFSSVGAQNPVGQTAVNNVISPYGMEVLVDQANGVKAFRAGPDASHPVVAGRPVFEGEGVSPVAVDPSSDATVLIPYVDDLDYKVSGDPTISHTQNLTISNPQYAALAMTEVESGRLMVMFDRQPMWNNGPGSDIEKRDNREILRRIVNYLAADQSSNPQDGDGSVTIAGELKQWHRVDLKQLAVHSSETATPNPFRDYRMNVTFTAPCGARYLVPGYFATDGNGGDAGNIWMAHLNPHETGEWSYTVSFRTGVDVAVSLEANAGADLAPFDGVNGTFIVGASDKTGDDFRATSKGMLINRGHHYLTYGGSGQPFLYTGPGIPENILGYRGFTNTTIGVGHEFTVHGAHWNAGDPDWGNQDGRNLIGALNYIADQGANCLYMMSNTIGGDGLDVFPHPTSNTTKDRYDLLKLRQWDAALAHAQAKGIFLHWHLAEHETGNNTYYGGSGSNNQNVANTMTVERKLYFRMLNAVFGHYNGLKWNIMEECEFVTGDRTAQMEYLKAVDPYGHPVTYQVGGIGISFNTYNNHLGQTNGIDAASFQGSNSRESMFNTIKSWRDTSAANGVKWTCAWDEPQRIDNDNVDEVLGYPMGRRDKMWPCLMGGGDGFMWYIQKDGGGHGFDQRIEDFTIMQNAFNWSGYARDFLGPLPLLEMQSSLSLVNSTAGADYTLFKPNQVYAIFNDRAGTGMTLDLSAAVGQFSVRWFNPRTGGSLQYGSVTQVNGGGVVDLGNAPATPTRTGPSWYRRSMDPPTTSTSTKARVAACIRKAIRCW